MNEAGKPVSPLAQYAELAIAIAVIALGVVVLWQTQDIRVTRASAQVGPKVIPTIIGIGQIVVGVWYAVEIVLFRRVAEIGADSEDLDPEAATDWRTLGILALALLAYTLLIETGGFIIASAAMFIIAAFGMGSRRFLRDASCAIVLSIAVFLIFDYWLGVRLTEGWLSGIL